MSAADIFISYCREDRSFARQFAERFADEGFKVWWDDVLHTGDTFDEVIETQLRAARAVVVLWSPRSVASRWVRAEATLADRNRKLAPVIIEECNRPIIFELTHTVDLSGWDGDGTDPTFQSFVRDLKRLVGPPSNQPAGEPENAVNEPAAQPALSPPSAPPISDYESTQYYTRAKTPDYLTEEFHCLEVSVGGDLTQRYVVGPVGVKIGRTAPADIILSDSRVSRTHCLVELDRESLRVTDLNSTNGTFIDGKRIEGSAPLAIGSVLKVGSVPFTHVIRTGAANERFELGAPAAVRAG